VTPASFDRRARRIHRLSERECLFLRGEDLEELTELSLLGEPALGHFRENLAGIVEASDGKPPASYPVVEVQGKPG
jgi:hypothetical protein